MRGAAFVVEPDDVARAEMADALRNMGFTTHETGSGRVAAFIAEQIHVQLALVNLALPDAKALKLIRRLRTVWPDAAIIALAPGAGVGAVLAHVAGADTTLTTPHTNAALGAAVSEASGHDRTAPQPA
ncbi:response regulator [Terricaulis silvestris]|nr:response regulator [Terricaulis silvestris]